MRPQLPNPCLTLITRVDLPDLAAAKRSTLKGPSLLAIAKAEAEFALLDRVRAALDGGVNVVQLRAKNLPAIELCQLGRSLRRITQGRALFIVNDRVDVALAVDADGAHLPENGLFVESARRLLGEHRLVGCSVHSVRSAGQRAALGVDYVQVGTIYATDSKPGQAPAGPQLVRDVTTEIRVPAVGVGGITARNAPEVMAAGACGVAAIGALLDAPDPAAAAQDLMSALRGPHAARYP